MATLSAAERIAQIRAKADEEIKQLKNTARNELKEQLKKAQAEVDRINAQIDELDDKPAGGKGGRQRAPRGSVTIEQIVESIKGGKTNFAQIAAELGVSKGTVTKRVEAEGKKAGITSKGERASFVLSVK